MVVRMLRGVTNGLRGAVSLQHRPFCCVITKIHGDDTGVEVSFDGGGSSYFHSEWLRHNCLCAQCREPHSHQDLRALSHSYAGDTHVPGSFSVAEGRELSVQWQSQHSSVWPATWLKQNRYDQPALDERRAQRQPPPLQAGRAIGSEDYSAYMRDDCSLWRALAHVNQHGLCVIDACPLVPHTVTQVAERVAPTMGTIYGKVFDVVDTPTPINIAYTRLALDVHMDLNYYESPPGLQLLHALSFDDGVQGGESVFVDSFAAAEVLRRESPKDFEVLCRVPATFQKVHYQRERPVHMVYQRPHIVVDAEGVVTAVNWSPPFEGPLRVSPSDVAPYYAAYHRLSEVIHRETLVLHHRLKEGQTVIFNNRRLLHGRASFVSSRKGRHLQGTYVNMDEYDSRYRVLCSQFAPHCVTHRVSNQCA